MSAYAKLRRKRQLFVDAYVRTGVGKDAAIASGYSGKAAHVAAAKLIANPEVKAAILERQQEAVERAGMRSTRVLEEIALLALVDPARLRGEDGKALTFKDIPAELLTAAQSIEFNADGSLRKVRFQKTDALRMAAQHLKLLTEVHEVAGKDGGPIQTHEVSDLEKARRIAHLLTQGLRAAAMPSTPLSDSESGQAGDSTAPSTSATSS